MRYAVVTLAVLLVLNLLLWIARIVVDILKFTGVMSE